MSPHHVSRVTRHASFATRHSSPAPRGLTLVEVMITMVIFVILAGFAMLAVREVVSSWSQAERRRVLYEKGAGVLDIIAGDIALAVTQEPAGVTQIKARFIGDFDPLTKQQRLLFVRTFEPGPERAITFNAGDGLSNAMMLAPQDGSAPSAAPGAARADSEEYNGLKVGDFKPLGGMAAVGYFTQDQVLYRAVRAPVPQDLRVLLNPAESQAVATDVLHLAFDYWSQETQSWEEQPVRSKTGGPEKIWDSTRAISASPLNNFRFHRGAESAADATDDIYPRKVRITVTVDSSMPRCVFTKLTEPMGDYDAGTIYADNTRGFPDGGTEESYLFIEGEWVHYKKKIPGGFEIDRRGTRGTLYKGHAEGAVIRCGKTFRRVVFIPNYREDLTTDEEYKARKEAQTVKPKRVVQP